LLDTGNLTSILPAFRFERIAQWIVKLKIGGRQRIAGEHFVRLQSLALRAPVHDTMQGSTAGEKCPMKLSTTTNLTVLKTLQDVREAGTALRDVVVKGVKLQSLNAKYWQSVVISNVYFIGCVFDGLGSQDILLSKGALVFPPISGLLYDPYRNDLYTPKELFSEFCPGTTLDKAIYDSFVAKGKFYPDTIEALMRRIHDDSIDAGLQELIKSRSEDKIVGVMGGSGNKRNDPWYRTTAVTGWLLARSGYFVMSGGGPGMMEAANLGAYLAKYDAPVVDKAIDLLKTALDQNTPEYWKTATEVKKMFPNGSESLGIPTWFYGFEATNLFSSRIAKYFANSIREAGMLQIARAGVIFAPGSAGTRQEIFMEAAQDHYGSTGYYSPMVFLGTKQYQTDPAVYPLVQSVAKGREYANFLAITDEPNDIVTFLQTHPPKPSQ
jgi:predicted Rossmann-fold nucleotide-binding protein